MPTGERGEVRESGRVPHDLLQPSWPTSCPTGPAASALAGHPLDTRPDHRSPRLPRRAVPRIVLLHEPSAEADLSVAAGDGVNGLGESSGSDPGMGVRRMDIQFSVGAFMYCNEYRPPASAAPGATGIDSDEGKVVNAFRLPSPAHDILGFEGNGATDRVGICPYRSRQGGKFLPSFLLPLLDVPGTLCGTGQG